MIYRRRVRKTGYSVRILTQHIKIELGKRVLYVPFDLGLGKPFHSLLRVFDRRGSETVTHVRRRDRRTVHIDALDFAYVDGFENACKFLQIKETPDKSN